MLACDCSFLCSLGELLLVRFLRTRFLFVYSVFVYTCLHSFARLAFTY